ncbi:MAG: hypothetical protein ACLPX5_16310 [Dissulfurispiraceae bacterium]
MKVRKILDTILPYGISCISMHFYWYGAAEGGRRYRQTSRATAVRIGSTGSPGGVDGTGGGE